MKVVFHFLNVLSAPKGPKIGRSSVSSRLLTESVYINKGKDMKKEIKNIKDESIRNFIETIDGFTPEQIKACEIYSDHIQGFLELFDLVTVNNLCSAMDTLEDLRQHTEKYLSTDLFDYIWQMSRIIFEDYWAELEEKYPEYNKIGIDGQIVFSLFEAEERDRNDFKEAMKKSLKMNCPLQENNKMKQCLS